MHRGSVVVLFLLGMLAGVAPALAHEGLPATGGTAAMIEATLREQGHEGGCARALGAGEGAPG